MVEVEVALGGDEKPMKFEKKDYLGKIKFSLVHRILVHRV